MPSKIPPSNSELCEAAGYCTADASKLVEDVGAVSEGNRWSLGRSERDGHSVCDGRRVHAAATDVDAISALEVDDLPPGARVQAGVQPRYRRVVESDIRGANFSADNNAAVSRTSQR